ncbi:hypothetical protein Tco_1467066 [Tanacetum coccineum]
MSSVVRRSLKKETSTLGEIVSLNYIKNGRNGINGGNRGNNGCTYKGFMACNPKEYDGKGAAATVGIPASIRRIPKNILDKVSQLR